MTKQQKLTKDESGISGSNSTTRGDKDKLTKVIERAMERGWDMFGYLPRIKTDELDWKISMHFGGKRPCLRLLVDGHTIERDYYMEQVLFSHDFAKHYWGEEEIKILFPTIKPPMRGTTVNVEDICWMWHITQAVRSKDPIDYYYKNK